MKSLFRKCFAKNIMFNQLTCHGLFYSQLALFSTQQSFSQKSQTLRKEPNRSMNATQEDIKENEFSHIHFKEQFKHAWLYNQIPTIEQNPKREKEEDKEKEIEKENDPSKKESKQKTTWKLLSKFVDLWKRTFPGEQNIELLMEARKYQAQQLKSKIKEPTEEEITKIEEAIPQWKRGAVVLISSDIVEEKRSIFEIARGNIAKHLKNLQVYREVQASYVNSELNMLIEDLKQSYANIKENLKESQNPFLVVSRDLIDKVNLTSSVAQATAIMRKYDPNFELVQFEKEVDIVFKQMLSAAMKDDMDGLKLVAGEAALAIFTTEIRERKERGVECKYKEPLFVEPAMYQSAEIIDQDTVVMRFTLQCQEINCKISIKDKKVVEGDVGLIENIQYIIDVIRNPSPVVEEVGHPYLIVNLQKIGVVRQLV